MAGGRGFNGAVVVYLLLFHLRSGEGLWCFHCSEFLGVNNFAGDCPSSGQDPSEWAKNSNKRYGLEGDDDELACTIVYENKDNGRIFHQTGVPRSRCSESGYRSTMVTSLSAAQGTRGDLQCCFNDGCNWNVTTARDNLGFSEFANGTVVGKDSDGGGGRDIDAVPFILIGFVLLTVLFCFCCFCCIWCANKRKEKEAANEKLYYGNSSAYSGVNDRGGWSLSGGPGRNFDRASEKSMRGTRRIDVAGAPGRATVVDPRDHERYSAIDKRLYRQPQRTSSQYSLSPRVSGRRRRPHLRSHSADSSGYYDGGDYDSRNRDRIGKVSRNVFDNDEFRAAHYKETSERQKLPQKYERMKYWQTDFTGNANKEAMARDSYTNAFRYGSA